MSKQTVFAFFKPFQEKQLLVETSSQEEAIKTFSKYLNTDPVNVMCWVEKGFIAVNSTINDAYYSNWWTPEKKSLEEFTILDVYKTCPCCGK